MAPCFPGRWGRKGLRSVRSRRASEHTSLLYWLSYNAANSGFLKITNDFEGGPQERAVDCGLGGLAERYAAELQCEVRLGARVVEVDGSDAAHVHLRLDGGDAIAARHVVLAVTPGVLGERLAFRPALSAAREALHRQPMGTACKVLAIYDAPWWHDAHEGHHFLGFAGGTYTDGAEWSLDGSHPDRTLSALMVFVSHAIFRRHAEDRAALEAAVVESIVELTGDERARDVKQLVLHSWPDEPNVGGGPNTLMGPGVLTAIGEELRAPVAAGRIHFAGAEYGAAFTGYVEGALVSGEQTAQAVARTLGSEVPTAYPVEVARPSLFMAALFGLLWALLAGVGRIVELVARRDLPEERRRSRDQRRRGREAAS